jgi:hypothetical protein
MSNFVASSFYMEEISMGDVSRKRRFLDWSAYRGQHHLESDVSQRSHRTASRGPSDGGRADIFPPNKSPDA